MKNSKRFSDTEFFNAVIGGGEIIEGSISCEGNLKIDCLFKGTINSKGIVFIGNNGKVQADIRCFGMIVDGRLKGKIIAAGKIEVRRSGILSGDVACDVIAVEETSPVARSNEVLFKWNTWMVYREKRRQKV